MPLKPRELRCIELARAHLGEVYGGTWRMTRELDKEHPSTASPEVEVSNGTATAAIIPHASMVPVNTLPQSLATLVQAAVSAPPVINPPRRLQIRAVPPPGTLRRIDARETASTGTLSNSRA